MKNVVQVDGMQTGTPGPKPTFKSEAKRRSTLTSRSTNPPESVSDWSSISRQTTRSNLSPNATPFESPRKVEAQLCTPCSPTGKPRSQSVPGRESDASSWTTITKKRSGSHSGRLTNQEKIAASSARTRLCPDFLLGKCTKGCKCTRLHDISFMVPDEQKVFIGGIPRTCTSRMLVAAVNALGFKVLNIPKCNSSGFAPKVCMESVEHAKAFLKVARIEVGGNIADVRRFKDSRAVNPDNFCVIIEGLPEGMTGVDVLEGLEQQGFLIERTPFVKAGSSTIDRCELATVENADALSEIGEITIKGHVLTVKPFFNLNDGRNVGQKAYSDGGSQRSARSANVGVSLSARGVRNRRNTGGSTMSVLSQALNGPSFPSTPERSMRRGRGRSKLQPQPTWSQTRAKAESIHSFLNRAMKVKSVLEDGTLKTDL